MKGRDERESPAATEESRDEAPRRRRPDPTERRPGTPEENAPEKQRDAPGPVEGGLGRGLPEAGSAPEEAVGAEPLGGARTARHARRSWAGRIFAAVCFLATLVGVVALAVLLTDVAMDGIPALDRDFLTSYASRFPERAGIKAPLYGTIWILGLTAVIAFPVSVGAAIYLEEYAPKNWVTRAIQTNIANLAGVPSIVYGILGLAVFVRFLALERSVISGALTLSLLILPVIIMASQEAVRAVPDTIRQAAYGLGATRWQAVRHQVLPMALPGILTGTILALSRAVGETAPLIMIGALTFIAFTPQGLGDPFTVLPIQIFNWVSRPQDEFRHLAAAAILVLLAILLTMNAAAILLRNRYQRRD